MSIEKKKKVWVQIGVVAIALLMMILIWPAKVVKHTIVSTPAEEAQGVEKSFIHSDKLLQTFTPQCDYLRMIRLHLSCEQANDTDEVTFVLYDSAYAPIYQKTVSGDELLGKTELELETELELVPGEVCYYELLIPEESQLQLQVLVGDRTSYEQVENGILFDAGAPDEIHSLTADYEYVQPLSPLRTIVYYIGIILLGSLLYIAITNLSVQFPRASEITGTVLRLIAAALATGFTIVALYFAVYRNYFGGALLDRIIYAFGIISALLWFMYAIYKKKRTAVEAIASTSAGDMWRAFLQTLAFAGVIYANCMYANATEMKYQYENTRWMMIFLGLALLVGLKMTFQKKIDVARIATEIVWLGGSFIYSIFYVKEFMSDENSYYLAKLYVAVIIIWGFLFIHVLWQLRKEQLKQISWSYVGVVAIFLLGVFAYRFEKIWPFEILVLLVVLLLQVWQDDVAKSRMMRNFCNGVLMAFVIMTVKTLLYRPYMKWMFYRYPGYFHTVACTGMFLAMVVCAALVKFYIKARESEHLFRDTWKEIFFCSIALVYTFMTMARTAILAIAVLYIGIICLTAFVYKKKWKQICLELVMVIGVSILSFPMVYTATRTIPAIVNEPYRFDPVEPTVEEYDQMIVKGDAPDSEKYMDMERFIKVFFARIKVPDFLVKQDVEVENKQAIDRTDIEENQETEESVVVNQQTIAADETITSEEATERVETASEEQDAEAAESTFEVSKGITNGRADIYKTYMSLLTIEGHEKMGYQSPDGTIDYGHAHNSYIQVAYDFGIPTGMMFLILCLVTFVRSVMMVIRQGKKKEYSLLLFGLVTVFGVVSVTEWAFHPSIPIGFGFIWAVGMLMVNKITK